MDVTLYTVGSALAGMEDGWYGGIVTIGDPEDLNIIDEFYRVGGEFILSYAEEKAALEHALSWLVTHDDKPSCATSCLRSFFLLY